MHGWTNDETHAMAARLDNDPADHGRAMTATMAYGADAAGLARHLRTLFGGAFGDAVVLEPEEGRFDLLDSRRTTRTANLRLVPRAVIKGGELRVEG